MIKKATACSTLLILLSACNNGGGNDSSDTPAHFENNEDTPVSSEEPIDNIQQGQFKDSNVEGLNYRLSSDKDTNTINNVTDSDGYFKYYIDDLITFSVGNVDLGTTNAKKIITPIDLVHEGDLENIGVINRIRFLMMLDFDGNPRNGIKISPSVTDTAKLWPVINFNATHFESELTNVIEDAIVADGGNHILPSAFEAKTHMKETMNCLYSGIYKGTYSGERDGVFAISISATEGKAKGQLFDFSSGNSDALYSILPISYGSTPTLHGTDLNAEISLTGNIKSTDDIDGNWSNSNSGESGTLKGVRLNNIYDTKWKFSGVIDNTRGAWFYSFNIDKLNEVNGSAVNIIDGKEIELTGLLNGYNISVSNAEEKIKINADIHSSEMNYIISGSWEDEMFGINGIITGEGCKLN